MRDRSSEAIVLRHVDYGESDRIVTLLTSDCGILKGFARGARKSRRRFGAALEPFSRISIRWVPPRSGEMVSLREAEILDLHAGLRDDLSPLALAGYGCELAEELLCGGEGCEPFDLLSSFLAFLSQGGDVSTARLLFELRVLHLAGYIPHFLHCAGCGTDLPPEGIAFDAAAGGSLCPSCSPGTRISVSLGTLGTLARSLRAPITLFEGFRFGERTLSEGGTVLADSLRGCLRRPLRSLSFLETILSGSPSQPFFERKEG